MGLALEQTHVRENETMKEIKLTRGWIALIDDEDFEQVNRFKWHSVYSKSEGTWYAARSTWRETGKPTKQYLHNFLMGVLRVDHRDCNGLNNQRSNLRPATAPQNGHNRRPKRGGTSKYKGVCRRKNRKSWRAAINIEGRDIELGSFACEKDAAAIYDAVAKVFFGEFARLNFPKIEQPTKI